MSCLHSRPGGCPVLERAQTQAQQQGMQDMWQPGEKAKIVALSCCEWCRGGSFYSFLGVPPPSSSPKEGEPTRASPYPTATLTPFLQRETSSTW